MFASSVSCSSCDRTTQIQFVTRQIRVDADTGDAAWTSDANTEPKAAGGQRVRYLHRHVVNVQAEGDSLVKSQLRLSGAVDVHRLFWLDKAFLVVDARLDHSVTDRLKHTRTLTPFHISVLINLFAFICCLWRGGGGDLEVGAACAPYVPPHFLLLYNYSKYWFELWGGGGVGGACITPHTDLRWHLIPTACTALSMSRTF